MLRNSYNKTNSHSCLYARTHKTRESRNHIYFSRFAFGFLRNAPTLNRLTDSKSVRIGDSSDNVDNTIQK